MGNKYELARYDTAIALLEYEGKKGWRSIEKVFRKTRKWISENKHVKEKIKKAKISLKSLVWDIKIRKYVFLVSKVL